MFKNIEFNQAIHSMIASLNCFQCSFYIKLPNIEELAQYCQSFHSYSWRRYDLLLNERRSVQKTKKIIMTTWQYVLI
jgi:hypothetical protein